MGFLLLFYFSIPTTMSIISIFRHRVECGIVSGFGSMYYSGLFLLSIFGGAFVWFLVYFSNFVWIRLFLIISIIIQRFMLWVAIFSVCSGHRRISSLPPITVY